MSNPLRVFEFTLWLADDPRDHEEWADAIYEAGGNDILPGVLAGKPYAAVHREAESLESAIRSASQTVRAAGLHVLRCEIEQEEMAGWTS